jgi:hypothetical protein
VGAFFGGCGTSSVIFFLSRFFYSPCYETPKNAIKKKSSKTTEGEKKRRGKKNIFCDEPRWIFWKEIFYCVFENEVSDCFFLGAAANVRHFHHFFSRPPLYLSFVFFEVF